MATNAGAAGGLIGTVAELITLVEPQLIRLWRADMTLSQRRVLGRLKRAGERTAGQLAAELGVAPPSLTRMLARLESRGFVTRAVDPADRRRVRVALTEAGREAMAALPVFQGSPLGLAAKELTPEERDGLAAALRAYLELARRHLPDPSTPD